MGFWEWLNGETETREETQAEVTPPVSDVLLKALLSNEVITREKALTLPAVSGAVDFVCNTVASMPVKLYKVKDNKVEEQMDDVRVKLLNGDTGDTLDAFQMKKAMVEDYLMGKGGYCYIERKRNEVISLRYVEDIYITVLKNFKPIYKDFEILVMGESYKPYDFIKLLRNTKDGASGVGLTVEVSKALETAYQTLLYQLSTVQSGGNKKGFLKAQRKLGQEEINALKKAWANLYANNSENVVVLNNGLEFQEASNSSVDMQLDQNKNTLKNEINNIFHIYPDDFNRTFKEAIYPIIRAFETALNRDLLLEKEKKNHFFEFDVKEIIKATLIERYQAYKLAKETGFKTINEIRRDENMNWIEGLDVVNVGLGAVLYDVNTHVYYTPNTDTVGNPTDDVSGDQGNIDKMLENHELAEAYDESGNSAEREIEERFNDVHDSKTGRFGSKAGSGGGGDSSGGGGSDNQAKIKELEEQLSKTSRFGAGKEKRKELQEQINKLKGYDANKAYAEQQAKKQAVQEKNKALKDAQKEKDENPVTPLKEKQFDIIQKNNAMTDDTHTGIRKPSDIKSAKEAFGAKDDYAYPDFTKADGAKALETGKVTVYSSKPIGAGGFVSPSKMMAQDYAGGGKVYSKEVKVDDIAWIDSNEGQYAKEK